MQTQQVLNTNNSRVKFKTFSVAFGLRRLEIPHNNFLKI